MYLLKIAFPSHPTTHSLNWWGEFLYSSCSYQCSYSSTPSARVRYPFGKQKGEKGKETFGKQPSVNIRVVTKWYAKVPQTISPQKAHRCPRDVLSWSRNLQGIGYTKKTAESSLFCTIVPTLISVYSSPTWCYACHQT